MFGNFHSKKKNGTIPQKTEYDSLSLKEVIQEESEHRMKNDN